MDPSRNGGASVEQHEHGSPPAAAFSIALEPSTGPSKTASSTSFKQPQTSIASGDQSLTSFPSLSPSLENSPQLTRHSEPTPRTPRQTDAPSISEPATSGYERLFTPTPSIIERSALFEDTPKPTREVPGTLHLQNDENVEHLLSKTGAVALVKQMAQDLAQRDAQVTLLQRRAEEREALLRRMLRECEVSNLDIENRLKGLERTKHGSTVTQADDLTGQATNFGTEADASMSDRMSLAFSDTHEAREDFEAEELRGFADNNSELGHTIRGTGRTSAQASLGGKSTTSRRWKDYFLPGVGVGRQSVPPQALARTDQTTSSATVTRSGLPSKELKSSVLNHPTPSLSRKSSTAPSLDEDDDQTLSRQDSIAESDSAASSRSVTAWALRLVAGNPQSSRNHLADQTNATSASSSGNRLDKKAASFSNSVANKTVTNATVRRLGVGDARSSRSSFISANQSNGNPKRAPSESSRASGKDVIASSSPPESVNGAETNLGPVEMDTILPEGTRPPTLTQNVPNSSADEYLTDSFGFIYDQRRRRRQNEAEIALAQDKFGNLMEPLHDHRSIGSNDFLDGDASSVENRPGLTKITSRPETPGSRINKSPTDPPKRWQDYLKLATFSTELLSHTPSAGPITDITTAELEEYRPEDRQMALHMSKRGSMPALGQVPTPSASRVVSDNAELVTPAASNPTSPSVESEADVDPVKALVEHLAEVHQAAQREKALKWNDFLRKVRVDRRRNFTSKAANENRSRSATMPETLLADGELIGIAGLGVKGKVGRAKGNEFRALILGGIPTAYRSKIWAEGSGAVNLRIPGYYEELTNSKFTDMAIVQQIQMDITRTLTDNVYYRRGAGVDKLKEVLLAYARRNPDIGYCQGMNLITANLLLIMPTAEDAFWVLTSMIENILPEKYYDSSLLTSRADQVVLRQYVSEILPRLSTHLENLGIELEALTFQWFLSVFTDCLSAEALFRVWDVILCIREGATFLFQVALALLKLNEKSLLACDNPAEVYAYINQGMTEHAISIDNLIRASEALKKEVRTEDILKMRQEAVALELETTRQREAIRKGKGKARATTSSSPPASDSPIRAGAYEPGRITAADDVVKGRTGKLIRHASRGDFDEEARQALGELEVRTPMPIDEEVLWRG